MTNSTVLALNLADSWGDFWRGNLGVWILDRGVRIALLVIGGLLAARFINWAANRIVRRIDAQYTESDQLVRSESTKHRQAVASVISWVSVALLFVVVAVEVTDVLAIPVGSLVAPAAVLGAALGFGAQRIVQDLLAGFFIITEKQYGFGDLVSLTVAGIALPAEGTVEDVTLRVTKLRSTEGEMFTIPNGQIVKTLNLSKDWARAVVDIPVPTSADLNVVNDVLHDVAESAVDDPALKDLLLDAPQMMGVESIELDTVNLRMVARTLPGKQYEVGRRIRVLVVRALRRAGIVSSDGNAPMVAAIPHAVGGFRRRGSGDAGRAGAETMTSWFKAKLGGRFRVVDLVLIVVFIALFWVQQSFQPEPAPEAPVPAVVPPGFVPDPNYTWVPRTQRPAAEGAGLPHDHHTDDHDRDDDTGAGRHHDQPDVAKPRPRR